MNWYILDKDYVKYLQQFDKLVPNIEYSDRVKCFLGVVLYTNGIEYFVPITSFKTKFINMKNDIDFYKIQDRKTNKIYGALDLNNMIPVMPNDYTKLNFDNLDDYRVFKNNRDKKQYWKLLEKEKSLLNEKMILKNAQKLYELRYKSPMNNISRRTCDFKLLEQKCLEYNKNNDILIKN